MKGGAVLIRSWYQATATRGMLVAMSVLTGKASDFLRVAAAAAGRGDLDTVAAVLAERSAWVARIGSHGRTLLWEAAYRGRLEVVDYLLDRGADIDACGCHFTPLLVEISPYCAARYQGHEAVADRLIERGAATDIYTAAFLGDHAAVVEYLEREPRLAAEEKPQHDVGLRATALHYAVSARRLDIVTTLLARGADPRPYSHWLIRFAMWRDRADILGALIDGGADPTRAEVPRSGVSAEIAAVLAAHGAGVSVDHAEGGWPPLVFQARGDRGGNVDRVRDLLDRGADVNVRNHKGQTALHCAARAGFLDIVALLLDRGADVGATDIDGRTSLALARRSTVRDKARLSVVIELLEAAGAAE